MQVKYAEYIEEQSICSRRVQIVVLKICEKYAGCEMQRGYLKWLI